MKLIELIQDAIDVARGTRRPISEIVLTPAAWKQLRAEIADVPMYPTSAPPEEPYQFNGYPVRIDEKQSLRYRIKFAP